MKATEKFSVPPQVIAREVGDQFVLLDIVANEPFGIDAIGARIWQLIEGSKTFGQICDELIEEYEVSREELERDVEDYIQDLLDRKLLLVQ